MSRSPGLNSAPDVLQDKLSFATKLAFGAGDLGTAITANLQVFFLFYFLTSVAGMNAGLAGKVLLVGKIWDAVNDPIVGVLSDRIQTPWGRRYPWMLLGSLPFGLTFVLMWLVPAENDWTLFWYYTIVGILFNTAFTAVNLPYTALTPELTQNYDERTSLNSFRFSFSIGGSILSLILARIIFQQVADPFQRYFVLAVVCAIISVLPIYWCIWGTRQRTRSKAQRPAVATPGGDQAIQAIPFLQQFRVAFTNAPFLFVIGIYLFSWLALQVVASVIPHFVVYCMELPDTEITTVSLGVQGTALLLLFFWSWVSRRVGKKAVYFVGMTFWIIAQAGLFFIQPDQVPLMYGLAVTAGIGVSTAYLIPWSMVPDVIDLDELNTGQRREGIFYGFMVLLQKMGLAFGLFLVGESLSMAGFIESAAGEVLPRQPDSALFAIRLAIGPIPTVCLILGVVLAYFYPITREVHGEILLKLHDRSRQPVDSEL